MTTPYMYRILGAAALILCGLGFTVAAHAQSTFGSIVGVVHDASQAVVPGAPVVIRSLEDNSSRSVTSDQNGSFEFVNLKPGDYALSAEAPGFAEFHVRSAELTARQTLRIDVILGIKSQSQTLEVSDTVAVINTENAVISDSKDNQQITQLPLNNRATTTSPLAALAISPNVQQDSSGNIALGGASSAMVNFSVDGISTANVRQNGALQDAYPSQEGISAMRVTAFNNSAEFSQVGDVTFTTKSGTSQYHGSLFEYFQNDALDADPYGFSGKAPKHFNTFGGSLGGPLSIPHFYNGKNKTFFFLDYEGNRRSTALAEQFLVPTQAERNGDLTALGGAVISPANINPTATALLNYYPLPNVTGQPNYNAVLGGWELTTVTLLETGPWLTPSISDSFDQSNTNVVNRGAFLRPDQVSTNFYQGQSRAQYFNLTAFAPTPAGAGRFGNAGVGILQGPGTTAASLGLAKVFHVTEDVRVRFESTFTNVLNHTNFAPPATQINNPTFGVLSAPQTAENAGNRTGQLALRIEF